MRDYLLKVLELTEPYRFRFVLGLLCGLLSGTLALALPISLKLAVDTVFPTERPAETNFVSVTQANSEGVTVAGGLGATTNAAGLVAAAGQNGGNTLSKPAKKSLANRLPAPLKHKLDALVNWFHPPGKPSTLRLILVISLIPVSMLLRSFVTYLNIYLLSWVGIRAANDLRVK